MQGGGKDAQQGKAAPVMWDLGFWLILPAKGRR